MIQNLVLILAGLSVVGFIAKWGYFRLHEMNKHNHHTATGS